MKEKFAFKLFLTLWKPISCIYIVMILVAAPKSDRGHIRVSSLDFKNAPLHSEDTYDKSQVVAVGTALPTLSMPPNSTQAQVMVSGKWYNNVWNERDKQLPIQ